MIDRSFIVLDRVGPEMERRIWAQGIRRWDDFLQAKRVDGISHARKAMYNLALQKAKRNLSVRNHPFFCDTLPSSEHWRLYDHFLDDALFVDIETTGYYGDMTVLGCYDGDETHILVRGKNLDKPSFQRVIRDKKMLVTFNGASFDLPIIRKFFGMPLDMLHVDLRHVCAKVGLTGGLKRIEKEIGISRADEVVGVSGADAITLWNKYRNSGDERYLRTLVKYNEEDIINLKPLAEQVIPQLWSQTHSVL